VWSTLAPKGNIRTDSKKRPETARSITEDFHVKPDVFSIRFVYCQQREQNDVVCEDNDHATANADRIY
jgi:hypothetical protein